MRKFLIAGACVAAVSMMTGCAAPDPGLVAKAKRVLTCQTGPECDQYWSRAQAYVLTHSGYRIQIETDSLIQTYGPLAHRTDLAWQVARMQRADGTSAIDAVANCDNMFGCTPDNWAAIADFKDYVEDYKSTREQQREFMNAFKVAQ